MSTPTPMNWPSLLSTQRFEVKNGILQVNSPSSHEMVLSGVRSEFHIDHDRVVFSSAFRRLGRKTQVHPLAPHDHTHNRLTHSVEVASVGRSLGNRVGAMMQESARLPQNYTPFDIGGVIQVACLAHDIGNPPFGHTGEDALRDWFLDPLHAHYLVGLNDAQRMDIQTYEGNAHGLRTLASLEMYGAEGGMRLTCASLGTLLKYPWTANVSPKPGKFNIYHTELAYMEKVADTLGLIRLSDTRWVRHPLSYLMEAADDICYAILDLEDAVEMGILDYYEFEQALGPLIDAEKTWQIKDVRQRCAAMRGSAVGKCVNEVADRFMAFERDLMRGEFAGNDLIDVCDQNVRNAVLAAKDVARRKVYHHRNKLVTEIASFPCMGFILDLLVPAVFTMISEGEARLNTRQKLALELLDGTVVPQDSLYIAYMKVLDFVGAMTDNYAANLAREISGVGIH